MDLENLKKNRWLFAAGGVAILILLIGFLSPSVNAFVIVKGIVGVPLMGILPGWIWLDVLSKRKWSMVERLAYAFMISIVLVGWTAYGLRAFVFDEINEILIMGTLLITIGLGLVVRVIQLKVSHGEKH
ncbi:MAG: hypothetical protein Q8P27_00870 [Candidatus Peregrinibacteria bacterium]|nr:hypothetical protein [Candidatus Peregrinibacteria bacterium]